MNLITGTGKMNFRSISYPISLFSLILILSSSEGCSGKENSDVRELTPRAVVTAANIEKKNINDTLFFNASSVFNNKTIVQSPVAGYLSTMNISNGMNISSDSARPFSG